MRLYHTVKIKPCMMLLDHTAVTFDQPYALLQQGGDV